MRKTKKIAKIVSLSSLLLLSPIVLAKSIPASAAGTDNSEKLTSELSILQSKEAEADKNPDVSDEKKANFKKEVSKIEADIKNKADESRTLKNISLALEYYEEPEKERDLSFDVFSDVHIESADLASPHTSTYVDAMQDIQYLHPDSDLMLNDGDFTQDGNDEQYDTFFNLTEQYRNAPLMVALGNHDVRKIADTFAQSYLSRNQKYMKDTPKGQLYWETWIKGYHFITLNTEYGLKDNAHLSQDQLDWLAKALKQDTDKKKPIFIQIHQAFQGTSDTGNSSLHWIYCPDQYSDSSFSGRTYPQPIINHEEALKNILKDHSNAVIFTGHAHNGSDLIDVFNMEYGHVVDLPSLGYSYDGYQVNVKGDEISLSLRDYQNDKWVTENEINFNLKDKDISTPEYDLPSDKIAVTAGSEAEPAANMLDNNADTYWQTAEVPMENRWIDFKVDEGYQVTGIRYLPKQVSPNEGLIDQYKIQVSKDGGETYEDFAEGKRQDHIRWKSLWFDEPQSVTNVRIQPEKTIKDTNCASAAELHLMGVKKADEGIKFGVSGIQIVKAGKTLDLAALTTPVDQKVTYTFSKDGIVTVDDKGLLTAVKPGMVKVTAKAGDKTAVVTVRVTQ